MGDVWGSVEARFAKLKRDVAEAISRPKRLLGDIWFSLLFVLVIAGLLLLAVIALILLPVAIVFWIVVRLCYWLTGRAAMWYKPESAGRLHRWPWLVNLLIFASIFAVIFWAGLPVVLWLLGKYFGWLVDLSWPVTGYLFSPLFAPCSDCEQTAIDWLSADGALGRIWFGWIAALLLAGTTISVFLRVTGEARRLSMLEADR